MAKKKTKSADESATTKKKTRKKAETAGDGAPKKKAKRKTRAKKEVVPDRYKLYWGVFNHAMKRVALFEFNQKKAAEKRAEELTEGGKPPHFVQKVKEVIEPTEILAE
ncbi:MAG: hypothetical protein R3C03_20240 [Pirellulaceae bacterium]